MRAPLSVIIPTRNAAAGIGPTVACLFEGLDAGLIREVIISDAGSNDGIKELADNLGASFVSGPGGRGGQLRRGAEQAGGDWLLFLHADTELCPGWSDEVRQHLMHHPGLAAAFRLSFRAAGFAPRLVASWANLRSSLLGLPYGDQGLLISRCLYHKIGGYPDIPLMEDVALSRALKKRIRLLPGRVKTDATRYETGGWVRHGAGNIRRQIRFLARGPSEHLGQNYHAENPERRR